MNPLADLVVFELGDQLSARFAGQLLALCGARVCHAQRADRSGAVVDQVENEFVNAGKQQIGLSQLHRTLAAGETLIVIRSGGAQDAPAVPAGVPVVDVAPLAFEGEARDWQADALVLSHLAGLGYVTPGGVTLDHPPLRLPRKLVQRAAGFSIAIAVMSLYRLAKSGMVSNAQVSEVESLFPMLAPLLSPFTLGEGLPTRDMAGPADLLTPCADGEVTFSFVQESEWQRFATLVDKPDWGEIFGGYTTRRENWHAIVEMLHDWLIAQTKREIFEACQAARVPCGMVQRASDVLANEQLRQRSFLRRLPAPSLGRECELPGLPWRFVTSPTEQRPSAAPAAGSPASPAPSQAISSARRGPLPLKGLRVLELGGFWAAPRCAAILAELGAEVIKIETVKRPDLRDLLVAEDGSVTVQSKPFFDVVNANKRACTIDLETEQGRRLFLDLVRVSHVVVENFRPGTLERFGLGLAALEAVSPRLVLISLSGFGQKGPYRGHSAYGPIVESMSGVRSLLGYKDDARTRLAGFSYSDPLAGALGALACLVALARVEREGRAVQADCSQIEGLLAVVPELLIEYAVTGENPGPEGNAEGNPPPYGLYRCAGDDRWLAIGFRPGDSWPDLCRELALDAAVEQAFACAPDRLWRADELRSIIAAVIAERDGFALAAALQARGIPAAVCHSIRDLFERQAMFDEGAFVWCGEGDDPRKRTYGTIIRFDGTRPTRYDPAPGFGADNVYVFEEILGLRADELEALAAQGAIR